MIEHHNQFPARLQHTPDLCAYLPNLRNVVQYPVRINDIEGVVRIRNLISATLLKRLERKFKKFKTRLCAKHGFGGQVQPVPMCSSTNQLLTIGSLANSSADQALSLNG